MFHLLTWVCARAGFDLFNSTEIFVVNPFPVSSI